MLKKLLPLFSLLIIAITCWITLNSTQPNNVLQEDIPRNDFSTSRAFSHVNAIAQKPHYVGSAEHSIVRNYIVNELQELGLQVQTQEAYVLNKRGNLVRPQNILSKIEGTESGQALVIMTHYDSQPHSSFGASDAGSGIATILEGIRAFLSQNTSHKNDIILLFTDAEELGLNGAELFVKEHPWAKEAKVALNFEARGSGGDSFMLLETNKGNAKLMQAFIEANPDYPVSNSLAYSVYKMLPNDTDLTVLREQGDINGFNFAFIDDHYDYHTANDVPENLDPETLAHQGSYLMPLLDYFKDADLSNLNSDDDLLYFNLPYIGMVHYPFSWIFPLLFGAILLFIGILIFGLIKQKVDVRGIFRGFVPLLLGLVAASVVTYFFWKLCLFIYPEYLEIAQGFTYNGYYYIGAAIFLALSIGFLTYNSFYKKEKAANIYFAPLAFWILICILTAVYLKGAAYFVIPLYFALFQLLAMIIWKRPNPLVMALLSIPAIVLLLPFITGFPVALGLKILFVAALLCYLLFTLLLPIFGYIRDTKGFALICFLVFNIMVFTAHFKSDFNEERPKPNSLVYLLDADKNSANWYTYDEVLDDWTMPYFGEEPTHLGPHTYSFSSKYNSGFSYSSKAPKIDIKGPGIFIEKTPNTSEKLNSYSVKIVPNRNINRIELYADRNIDFEDFLVNGLEADPVYFGENEFHIFKKRWDTRLLNYYVATKDTLRLEFSLETDKTAEFTLFESSYDLLANPQLGVPARQKAMIPKPFVLNDAVIFKKTITID